MVKEFENNHWALIIGGSSGLGLASAKKLAKHGLNIIIVHRDRKSDETIINESFDEIRNSGVKLITYNQDAIRSEKMMDTIVDIKNQIKTDKIKTVVHSIAKGNLKPMLDENTSLKSDDFAITIDAMATSFYRWTQELIHQDLLDKDGRLIAFTSEGNQRVWENYAAVSAAKVALEAISRSMALEFAPIGLKVNCIQAGITDTKALRMIPGNEVLVETALKRNPNQRLTKPEDVANVVYLLNKKEASWITGTIIPVDGGEHLR